MKSIKDLWEKYDFELNRIVKEIKRKKHKIVLLQFPDGLKPYATAVVEQLKKKCKGVEFFIWFGSCFGACDAPILGKDLEKKIDLIVQIGHNEMVPKI
ncbi:hypothetical protein CMI44_00760 [Candidatus Pacearchaeota archaeon]|nr:hypothetical protein [Candidatus Pacearchaeota archaeon]|tara:strand:+ start:1043 stop:1336 length:294 start_codon:yes stop_codon:yes gene_type:complete